MLILQHLLKSYFEIIIMEYQAEDKQARYLTQNEQQKESGAYK